MNHLDQEAIGPARDVFVNDVAAVARRLHQVMPPPIFGLSYENRASARDLAEERQYARQFLADPATPSAFGWLQTPDFPEGSHE